MAVHTQSPDDAVRTLSEAFDGRKVAELAGRGEVAAIQAHLDGLCEKTSAAGPGGIDLCALLRGRTDGPPSAGSGRALERPLRPHVRPLGSDAFLKAHRLAHGLSSARPIRGTIDAIPCDAFTNETVIGACLTTGCGRGMLEAAVPLRAACVCRSGSFAVGYQITGACDGGELQRYPVCGNETEFVLAVLGQAILSLAHLQREHGFVHGDLKTANVLVRGRRDPGARGARCAVPGPGGEARTFELAPSPFLVALSDFGTSAATFPALSSGAERRTRYFSYRRLPWVPAPLGLLYSRRVRTAAETFTIGAARPRPLFYRRLRHSPGLEFPTLDTYTLLVSLAFEDAFFRHFTADPVVRRAWAGIWIEGELEIAESRIARVRATVVPRVRATIGAALHVLEGLHLRSDATTIFADALTAVLIERGLGAWVPGGLGEGG